MGKYKLGGQTLFRGRGGFWSDVGRGMQRAAGVISSGFHSKGDQIKSALNRIPGLNLGDKITAAENAARALGIGAYSVGRSGTISNDIVNGGMNQGIPVFKTGVNEVRISHKEFVTDIYAPDKAGQFTNYVLPINPGLQSSFPWLAQVASNYEEYSINQCIYTFRSTVSDFVAGNGQVGTIIMASQYNPSDAPFNSKQDAMEYDMAMSGKATQNMMHGVECDPKLRAGTWGKYTRAGPVKPDEDLKSYDWANLNVCLANTPETYNSQALGELWVSYTVTLRKPKFFVSRALNAEEEVFNIQPRTQIDAINFTKAAQQTTPIDLTTLTISAGQQNRIGCKIVPNTGANNFRSFGLKFPDTYSGNVLVSLKATLIGMPVTVTVPPQATGSILASRGCRVSCIADGVTTDNVVTGMLPIPTFIAGPVANSLATGSQASAFTTNQVCCSQPAVAALNTTTTPYTGIVFTSGQSSSMTLISCDSTWQVSSPVSAGIVSTGTNTDNTLWFQFNDASGTNTTTNWPNVIVTNIQIHIRPINGAFSKDLLNPAFGVSPLGPTMYVDPSTSEMLSPYPLSPLPGTAA